MTLSVAARRPVLARSFATVSRETRHHPNQTCASLLETSEDAASFCLLRKLCKTQAGLQKLLQSHTRQLRCASPSQSFLQPSALLSLSPAWTDDPGPFCFNVAEFSEKSPYHHSSLFKDSLIVSPEALAHVAVALCRAQFQQSPAFSFLKKDKLLRGRILSERHQRAHLGGDTTQGLDHGDNQGLAAINRPRRRPRQEEALLRLQQRRDNGVNSPGRTSSLRRLHRGKEDCRKDHHACTGKAPFVLGPGSVKGYPEDVSPSPSPPLGARGFDLLTGSICLTSFSGRAKLGSLAPEAADFLLHHAVRLIMKDRKTNGEKTPSTSGPTPPPSSCPKSSSLASPPSAPPSEYHLDTQSSTCDPGSHSSRDYPRETLSLGDPSPSTLCHRIPVDRSHLGCTGASVSSFTSATYSLTLLALSFAPSRSLHPAAVAILLEPLPLLLPYFSLQDVSQTLTFLSQLPRSLSFRQSHSGGKSNREGVAVTVGNAPLHHPLYRVPFSPGMSVITSAPSVSHASMSQTKEGAEMLRGHALKRCSLGRSCPKHKPASEAVPSPAVSSLPENNIPSCPHTSDMSQKIASSIPLSHYLSLVASRLGSRTPFSLLPVDLTAVSSPLDAFKNLTLILSSFSSCRFALPSSLLDLFLSSASSLASCWDSHTAQCHGGAWYRDRPSELCVSTREAGAVASPLQCSAARMPFLSRRGCRLAVQAMTEGTPEKASSSSCPSSSASFMKTAVGSGQWTSKGQAKMTAVPAASRNSSSFAVSAKFFRAFSAQCVLGFGSKGRGRGDDRGGVQGSDLAQHAIRHDLSSRKSSKGRSLDALRGSSVVLPGVQEDSWLRTKALPLEEHETCSRSMQGENSGVNSHHGCGSSSQEVLPLIHPLPSPRSVSSPSLPSVGAPASCLSPSSFSPISVLSGTLPSSAGLLPSHVLTSVTVVSAGIVALLDASVEGPCTGSHEDILQTRFRNLRDYLCEMFFSMYSSGISSQHDGEAIADCLDSCATIDALASTIRDDELVAPWLRAPQRACLAPSSCASSPASPRSARSSVTRSLTVPVSPGCIAARRDASALPLLNDGEPRQLSCIGADGDCPLTGVAGSRGQAAGERCEAGDSCSHTGGRAAAPDASHSPSHLPDCWEIPDFRTRRSLEGVPGGVTSIQALKSDHTDGGDNGAEHPARDLERKTHGIHTVFPFSGVCGEGRAVACFRSHLSSLGGIIANLVRPPLEALAPELSRGHGQRVPGDEQTSSPCRELDAPTDALACGGFASRPRISATVSPSMPSPVDGVHHFDRRSTACRWPSFVFTPFLRASVQLSLCLPLRSLHFFLWSWATEPHQWSITALVHLARALLAADERPSAPWTDRGQTRVDAAEPDSPNLRREPHAKTLHCTAHTRPLPAAVRKPRLPGSINPAGAFVVLMLHMTQRLAGGQAGKNFRQSVSVAGDGPVSKRTPKAERTDEHRQRELSRNLGQHSGVSSRPAAAEFKWRAPLGEAVSCVSSEASFKRPSASSDLSIRSSLEGSKCSFVPVEVGALLLGIVCNRSVFRFTCLRSPSLSASPRLPIAGGPSRTCPWLPPVSTFSPVHLDSSERYIHATVAPDGDIRGHGRVKEGWNTREVVTAGNSPEIVALFSKDVHAEMIEAVALTLVHAVLSQVTRVLGFMKEKELGDLWLSLLAWQHLGVLWHSADLRRSVCSLSSPGLPFSCETSLSLRVPSPFCSFSLAGLRVCLLLTERVSPSWEKHRFSSFGDRRVTSSSKPFFSQAVSRPLSSCRPPFTSSFDPTAKAISRVLEETLGHIDPRHKNFVLLNTSC
ncbi:hypothetical protein CSUI_003578 [Cystoisospora suis]|uniref:Uncharacterized protein n=1 Tax=Cystoisospora suis TaxID=483139 RepID=A0A2C6L4K5_9APIC|nr:hypothetical protein CSUI_003578 [Cystoisospora suis]